MDLIQQFDGNLLIGIQRALNAEWLTPVMKLITAFGEHGLFWIVLCLLLIAVKRTRRLGIICACSLAFTFLCCNLVIKPLVDRTRPWIVFKAVHAFLPPPGDSSFPSGHSANSMAPAWAMYYLTRPKKKKGSSGTRKDYSGVTCLGWRNDGASPELMHRIGIAAVVLALLIGLSRLYLGMHFPTDVVCGLLLGMMCAVIVCKAAERGEKKRGVLGSSARIALMRKRYNRRKEKDE